MFCFFPLPKREILMADYMAAEILIGGRIPANIVPELCQAIRQERLGLDYDRACFEPDSASDLVEACRADSHGALVLKLSDDQARWGEFEQLERFLQQNGIAYTRRSEGKYDCDPEQVEFRPRQSVVVIPTNSAGKPMVRARELEPVQAQLQQAIELASSRDCSAAMTLLRTAHETLRQCLPSRVPPLESLTVLEASGLINEPISSQIDPDRAKATAGADADHVNSEAEVSLTLQPPCSGTAPTKLRIDLGLLHAQGELLAQITDLARQNLPYTPAKGDAKFLEGLLELVEAVVDATADPAT